MSSFMRKFKIFAAGAFAVAGMVMAVPAASNAAGEELTASFSLQPQSGQFLNNGFTPANLEIENSVATADPLTPEILPAKVIDLTLPAGEMTFSPGNMPVCPASQIGPPPVNLSVPVPVAVARCSDSVLGNGTGTFVLNRNNLSPQAVLDGVIVLFNGGLQNGRPLLKVYVYSYDTTVAIYTEAALQADGSLVFQVPQLSSDSSVSSLNFAIPSQNITLTNVGPGAETVAVPKGEKSDYVQGKCSTGSYPWGAEFTFGTRDTDDTPTSPNTFASDSGVEPCSGVSGKAKIGNVKVKGAKKVKRNKKTTYKVKVKNVGSTTAKGVKVKMSGKGVKASGKAGNIPAGKTKTVKLKAKFKKKGKVKAKFKVTSNNAGNKTAKKTVKVK